MLSTGVKQRKAIAKDDKVLELTGCKSFYRSSGILRSPINLVANCCAIDRFVVKQIPGRQQRGEYDLRTGFPTFR